MDVRERVIVLVVTGWWAPIDGVVRMWGRSGGEECLKYGGDHLQHVFSPTLRHPFPIFFCSFS